ncbi:MAG: hypothetical protein PHH85_00750 [Candidatus Methanoperedens sp.]|nr:hypothetical protein [Candidatus Methanoperedens sp.]
MNTNTNNNWQGPLGDERAEYGKKVLEGSVPGFPRKNPYIFDFLGLTDSDVLHESKPEKNHYHQPPIIPS